MASGIKKFLIVNSYIIGTVIIVIGFFWMATLAAVAAPINQTMIAFTFTISGIAFWAIGYYSSDGRAEGEKKEEKKEKKEEKKENPQQ